MTDISSSHPGAATRVLRDEPRGVRHALQAGPRDCRRRTAAAHRSLARHNRQSVEMAAPPVPPERADHDGPELVVRLQDVMGSSYLWLPRGERAPDGLGTRRMPDVER